jgi:manganese/zinc/iron transport system substrate-binding protein
MKKYLMLIILVLGIVILQGCVNSYKYQEGKINVVATTTMLGDLAKEIGGKDVSVTTLMGVGVDPHLYTPKPSDTSALKKADFVLFNGEHLEGKMTSILESIIQDKAGLDAAKSIEERGVSLLTDEFDNVDPHIWFDVSNWMIVAQNLANKFIKLDQENELNYETNLEVYLKKLVDLEQYIKEKVSLINEESRVLITAHDAFGYFGNAYGFEIHGVQGISTESEATIEDINTMVNLIISRNIKAIFVELSVSSKTVEALINQAKSRGYELSIGGTLYSDSLGDGIYQSYIEAFKRNVDLIVEGLKDE